MIGCKLSEKCVPFFATLIIMIMQSGFTIHEYASPVWSPWQAGDKELLEKTQRKCLRLCQEDIQLESLESRRDRMDLVETFKFKNKTPPSDIMFTSSHTGQLRGAL